MKPNSVNNKKEFTRRTFNMSREGRVCSCCGLLYTSILIRLRTAYSDKKGSFQKLKFFFLKNVRCTQRIGNKAIPKKSGVYQELGISQYLKCLLLQYNVATTEWKYELITFKQCIITPFRYTCLRATNTMNKNAVLDYYCAARN